MIKLQCFIIVEEGPKQTIQWISIIEDNLETFGIKQAGNIYIEKPVSIQLLRFHRLLKGI